MSGARWIKTKRETIYRQLVANLDDPPKQPPDHDVYPFEVGYELFTAGLVAGYIDGEQYDGKYDGEGEYYRLVRFVNFADNNPEHVDCIDLFQQLLHLEEQAESDDPVEVTWDDIVAYADKGVGTLNGKWNEDKQLDLPQYFSSVEYEVENALEEFRDELTQEPSTGDRGNLSI
jgi:hypothetical protein